MRFSNLLYCLAVFAMLVFGVEAARANVYTFTVDLKGGPDFSFNLDKTPPDFSNPGLSFGKYNVPTTSIGLMDIYFYAPAIGNGFSILQNGLSFLDSSTDLPLYRGAEDKPEFLTGTFVLKNIFGDVQGSVQITAAVPEASTWAMMILGFVGVAVLGYRRRRSSVPGPLSQLDCCRPLR